MLPWRAEVIDINVPAEQRFVTHLKPTDAPRSPS